MGSGASICTRGMGPKQPPPDNTNNSDNSEMTSEIPSNNNNSHSNQDNIDQQSFNNNNNNIDSHSNHTNSPDRYSIQSLSLQRTGYLEITPRGCERDTYKYFCPICFLYYKNREFMFKCSSCCNSPICTVCILEFLNTKGINVRSKEDILKLTHNNNNNNNSSSSSSCNHSLHGVRCPCCGSGSTVNDITNNNNSSSSSSGFFPSELLECDTRTYFLESPIAVNNDYYDDDIGNSNKNSSSNNNDNDFQSIDEATTITTISNGSSTKNAAHLSFHSPLKAGDSFEKMALKMKKINYPTTTTTTTTTNSSSRPHSRCRNEDEDVVATINLTLPVLGGVRDYDIPDVLVEAVLPSSLSLLPTSTTSSNGSGSRSSTAEIVACIVNQATSSASQVLLSL